MLLRLRYDAADAQSRLGRKFGCDLSEAARLLKIAKNLKINVIGVSFHVGSGCREKEAYGRAIAAAREVFDHALIVGFNFDLLDIGGGYPGHKGSSIKEVNKYRFG